MLFIFVLKFLHGQHSTMTIAAHKIKSSVHRRDRGTRKGAAAIAKDMQKRSADVN